MKPATELDDSIAGVLAGMPKMRLEEPTEGTSSTGPPGRKPAMASGDKAEGEVADDDVSFTKCAQKTYQGDGVVFANPLKRAT